MIFHEHCLLADNSHVISCLIFLKIRGNAAKFIVCSSRDWRFKGKNKITIEFIKSTLNDTKFSIPLQLKIPIYNS